MDLHRDQGGLGFSVKMMTLIMMMMMMMTMTVMMKMMMILLQTETVDLHRDQGGLGFSIAGGRGSVPFKGNNNVSLPLGVWS